MEAQEFMSPDGRTQMVADPAEAVRLRAHGWWPVVELTEQASVPGPAAEWLERAAAARAEREERARQRQDAASMPPGYEDAPAKKTAAKRTTK